MSKVFADSMNGDGTDCKAQVSSLLKTSPGLGDSTISVDRQILEMFLNMKPISMSQLRYYWQLSDTTVPLFDCDNADYEEWETVAARYQGTRVNDSLQKQGYVRETWQGSALWEQTYLDGVKNGLYR